MLLPRKLISTIQRIHGWLTEDEADALLSAVIDAVLETDYRAVVEIGSYKGRSTVLLAKTLEAIAPGGRLYAIDPHDGNVPGFDNHPPTWEEWQRTIEAHGCVNVEPMRMTAIDASYRIADSLTLAFIDGLHDYDSIVRDYEAVEPLMVSGSIVAFHDYGNPQFPDVQRAVDALAENAPLTWIGRYDTLAVLKV